MLIAVIWLLYQILVLNEIVSALLRKILVENPVKRVTMEAIKKNSWFTKNFSRDGGGMDWSKLDNVVTVLVEINYCHVYLAND